MTETKPTSETEIQGISNRGTDEVPFGYVFVGDTRVGFHVEIRDTLKPTPMVWASRPEGYWPTPTGRQFRAAKEALVAAGIFADVDEIVAR